MPKPSTLARMFETRLSAHTVKASHKKVISLTPTLKDILGRGLLPQELPPPFNSLLLGRFAESRGTTALPFDTTTKGFKTSRPEIYNLARAGSFRRDLAILNPIHFSVLAECIVANWAQISKLPKSTLSLTLPTPTAEGRAISRLFALDILPKRRAEVRSQGSFLLKADVARFYPSIYTHSIPWAAHGKSFAKTNRDLKYWGNKVDLLSRNCQDGQTNGIPVGPDTSLVISELLLARIDKFISSRRIRGLRYMDDYELVFKSEEQALEVRSQLQEALLEFELDLSTAKTTILPLPQILEDGWVSALNLFEMYEGSQYFETQIIRFFDKAFELARLYPREGVLKYAAGRVTKLRLLEKHAELVEHLLMQCAQVETGALSFVLASMLKNPAKNKETQKRRRLMLLQIVETHAPQRHSSEVAWAIWACIAMKLSLPRSVVRAALKMEDSVCALLMLHARESNLVDEPKELQVLSKELKAEALYGPRWLLAYEANIKRWFRFRGAKDYVAQDRNFRFLKKAGVSFYDKSKTILPTIQPSTQRTKVVDDYLSKIAFGYGRKVIDENDEEENEDEENLGEN